MKKKLLAVLLTVILAATGIFPPIQVQAEEESGLEASEQGYQAKTRMAGKEIVDRGQCGENVCWTLDKDGTLTITGGGEMYGEYTGYLWGRGDDIRSVVIEEGVTSIGYSAFYNCSSLTSVNIPESVTSIGSYTF